MWKELGVVGGHVRWQARDQKSGSPKVGPIHQNIAWRTATYFDLVGGNHFSSLQTFHESQLTDPTSVLRNFVRDCSVALLGRIPVGRGPRGCAHHVGS